MKVLVLGGAGAMGQVIVRDLLQWADIDRVSIGDVDLSRAQRFAKQLATAQVKPVKVDARDRGALDGLLNRHDVVVNSTWYELNLEIMAASIRAGTPYCDLGGLYHVTLRQLTLDHAARDAGVACIVGIGSTPGTMNVMAAHAAAAVDRIEKVRLRSGSAVVGSRHSDSFQSPYSIRTVLDEFTLPAVVLKNGAIQEMPALSGKERFVLPAPVNEVEGYYTLHSELATLPENLGKGVKDMDFIVAYPPDFTRTVTLLVKMGLASKEKLTAGGAQVRPYDVLAAAIESTKGEEQELDIDVQRVEIYGRRRGKPVLLRIDSISKPKSAWRVGGGTVGTGTPPSIAAQWLANGRIAARGVVPPELCIEPLPFFKELRRRGIRTYEYRDGAPRLL